MSVSAPSAAPPSPDAAPQPRIDLAEALARQWFEVWYQPKIDLKRKCLAGAEALARLRHPTHGLMLPGSFTAAVTVDSLRDLSHLVLEAALRDWAAFDAAGVNLLLSVNAPMRVLQSLPVADLVRARRPASANWPGLIVEVAEDQIVRDIKGAQQLAAELAKSNVRISIDDFGAGYSSFHSLRELPFAELKLDASFVAGCAVDPTNAAICQTAIDLAHRFGGAAVGEGIDGGADLQALMMMGCDYGQGALVAPDMPAAAFVEMLGQRLGRTRPAPAASGMAAAPQTGSAA